jgi:hypothetical protein
LQLSLFLKSTKMVSSKSLKDHFHQSMKPSFTIKWDYKLLELHQIVLFQPIQLQMNPQQLKVVRIFQRFQVQASIWWKITFTVWESLEKERNHSAKKGTELDLYLSKTDSLQSMTSSDW